MWIEGSKLTQEQREQVLRAFVNRWTKDNPNRELVWSKVDSKPTVPLISDEEWLSRYRFNFTKAGRLDWRTHYCEPVLPPPPPPAPQATKAERYTMSCLAEQ